MDTVTLQGPVIVLPATEYQTIVTRLTELEQMVQLLTERLENVEDRRVMREAEAEYRAGDTAVFADILAEIQAESV